MLDLDRTCIRLRPARRWCRPTRLSNALFKSPLSLSHALQARCDVSGCAVPARCRARCAVCATNGSGVRADVLSALPVPLRPLGGQLSSGRLTF